MLFSQISGIDINSAGQIFVADTDAVQVFVFSETGEFIRIIGREGKGPGEFTGINGISVGPGDSLFVLNWSPKHLSVFEPEWHQFEYSLRIPETLLSYPDELLGVTERGYYILYQSVFSFLGYFEEQPSLADAGRYAMVYFIGTDGSMSDEPVMKLPGRKFIVSTETSGMLIRPLPFGRHFTYRVDSAGLLYSGWNDTIDILVSADDGQVHRTIRIDHQPLKVTRADIDSLLASLSSRNSRKMVMDADLPKTRPAYESFAVDDKGRVWVRITTAKETDTVSWTIISRENTAVADAILPANVKLWFIEGARAYGTAENELGAEYVVVYSTTGV